MAAAEEEVLIQQLDVVANGDTKARQAWYKAAYDYLIKQQHWWCTHTRVTQALSAVLSYETQPVVKHIWTETSRQLSGCAQCIRQYRAAQASYASATGEPQVQLLLEVMARRDAERVAGWLEAGEREMQQQTDQQAAPPQQVVLGLFEALSHPTLLADAEVMSRLVTALLTLSRDHSLSAELADGGRYPGLYMLAAHPDQAVRALVLPAIQQLGPLASWEEAQEAQLDVVLSQWAARARKAVPLAPGVVKAEPEAAAAVGPGGRPLFEQPLESLLLGLKVLLQALQPPALAAAVAAVPDLPVALFACVLAWRRAAGEDVSGNRAADGGPAAVAAPSPPPPAFRHLLGCLLPLARRLGAGELLPACAAAASGVLGGSVGGFTSEVDGVGALTAALGEAAFSTTDASLHKLIIDVCGALLTTLARDDASPPRDLRRLLAFLIRDVHVSFFLPYGGGVPYNALSRTVAALAGFSSVALACCSGGRCPAFASDLFGQAASQAVMAVGGQPSAGPNAVSPGLEAKMVEAAADVICLVLQVDATAIAAALDPAYSTERRSCPGVAGALFNPYDVIRPGLPLAAASAENADAAAAAACESALADLDGYYCTPAAYMAVAGCPHPAVALSLILAAGHCAELEDDPRVGHEVGGWHGADLGHPAALPSPSASFLAAAQWPVRPRAEGPNGCAVAVTQCPGLLLKQLRQAAVVHLQHAAREAHVLGIASDGLPGCPLAPLPAGKPGLPPPDAVAREVAARAEGAALAALIRLVCGSHPELRAAAEDALVLHFLTPERARETRAEAAAEGGCRGPLEMALMEGWLRASLDHSAVVLSTCGKVLEDLSRVRPVEKLMSSGRLAPTLSCLQAVLRACDSHRHLDGQAFTLAHCTWALIVQILEQGLAGYTDRPDCRSGVAPLVALLPICWYFLLVAPEGRAPAPRLMRAWLPAALRWVPALAASSGGPRGTCAALVGSLELMMGTVRDNGPLPQDVLAAAREALSPRHEALSGDLRMRLAELFPEVAPGNLGTTARKPLANLPSRGGAAAAAAVPAAAAAVARDKAAAPGSSVASGTAQRSVTAGPSDAAGPVVVDLTLSDDEEEEAAAATAVVTEEQEEEEQEEEEEDEEEEGAAGMDEDVLQMLEGLEWEEEAVPEADLGPGRSDAQAADTAAAEGSGSGAGAAAAPSASASGAATQAPKPVGSDVPTAATAAAAAAAAIRRAGAAEPGGGSPAVNVNNPFAVFARHRPEPSPDSPAAVPAAAARPAVKAQAAPSAAADAGGKATADKISVFDTIRAIESALVRTARGARSAGGPSTTRAGGLDLPQSWRTLNKLKQAAAAAAGAAGAPAPGTAGAAAVDEDGVPIAARKPKPKKRARGASAAAAAAPAEAAAGAAADRDRPEWWPDHWQGAGAGGAGAGGAAGAGAAKAQPRTANTGKADKWRKELLGRLGGDGGARDEAGGGGRGGVEGGGRARGWAVGGGGGGRSGNAAPLMPAPDPLLQQPLPSLRALHQQRRATEAAAAAAAAAAAKQMEKDPSPPPAAAAAPANAGVLVMDDEDSLFGDAPVAVAARPTGLAAGLPRARLGLGLMAAAGLAPRARGVVHLNTAGQRPANAPKPLPPLQPVLYMSQVVRQVVQLGVDVLLPGLGSSDATGRRDPGLTAHSSTLKRLAVPVSFTSLEHYTNTFRALLMEELATAVRSSVEELAAGGGGGGGGGGAPPSLRAEVATMSRTDDMHSIALRVENREGAQRDMCRQEDLVLLTRRPLASAAAVAKPPAPCVLGVVNEVAAEDGGWMVTLQACLNPPGATAAQRLEGVLLPRSEWHLTVLHSLVPHFREFAALCHLPRLHDPTVRYLLNPKPPAAAASAASAGPCWDAASLPPPLKSGLATAFNDSQRQAILSALDASPFTLVQGPPGTGKTSAIMGIISVLLGRHDITEYKQAVAAGLATKYDRGADVADAGGGAGGPARPAAQGRAAIGGRKAGAAGPARGAAAAAAAAAPGGGSATGTLKKSSAAKRFEAAKAAAAAASGTAAAAKDGAAAAAAGGSGTAATTAGSDPPRGKQHGRSSSEDGEAAQPSDVPSRGSSGGGAAAAAAAPPPTGRQALPTALQEALDAFDLANQPRCRVLVCAQSNAAIDELLTRLAAEGVWRPDGRRRPPAVVRLGRVEVAHGSVHALHVDALAEQLAGKHRGTAEAAAALEDARREVTDARREFEEVDLELEQLERRLAQREQQKEQQQESGKAGPSNGDGDASGGGEEEDDMDLCGSGDEGEDGPARKKRRRSRAEPGEVLPNGGEGGGESGGGGGSGGGSGGGEGTDDAAPLTAQIKALRLRRKRLWDKWQFTERSQRRGSKELERQRKEMRQAVVLAAEVVVTTLSAAGGDLTSLLSAATTAAATAAGPGGGGAARAGGGGSGGGVLPVGPPRFGALVIDEAAQALEPAALIPLQLLQPAAKVVLVGDPRQLPPTVLSRAADAARLSQSLFERLQSAGCRVCLLSRQYRMHPAISRFPSSFFYEGTLLDGETITAASRSAPCHSHPLFGPLVVYDCVEGREQGGGGGAGAKGGSLRNFAEADLVAELYAGLASRFPDWRPRIAILTPYRAQLVALRAALRKRAGVREEELSERVDIGTVDGYQGREADVVIFSAVRAKPPPPAGAGGAGAGASSVGFLADVRRMNVALTRARRCLWVVGHVATLASSPPWLALLRHAATHGSLMSVPGPFRRMLAASPAGVTASCRVTEESLEQMVAARGGGFYAAGKDADGALAGGDARPEVPTRPASAANERGRDGTGKTVGRPNRQAAGSVQGLVSTNAAGGASGAGADGTAGAGGQAGGARPRFGMSRLGPASRTGGGPPAGELQRPTSGGGSDGGGGSGGGSGGGAAAVAAAAAGRGGSGIGFGHRLQHRRDLQGRADGVGAQGAAAASGLAAGEHTRPGCSDSGATGKRAAEGSAADGTERPPKRQAVDGGLGASADAAASAAAPPRPPRPQPAHPPSSQPPAGRQPGGAVSSGGSAQGSAAGRPSTSATPGDGAALPAGETKAGAAERMSGRGSAGGQAAGSGGTVGAQHAQHEVSSLPPKGAPWPQRQRSTSTATTGVAPPAPAAAAGDVAAAAPTRPGLELRAKLPTIAGCPGGARPSGDDRRPVGPERGTGSGSTSHPRGSLKDSGDAPQAPKTAAVGRSLRDMLPQHERRPAERAPQGPRPGAAPVARVAPAFRAPEGLREAGPFQDLGRPRDRTTTAVDRDSDRDGARDRCKSRDRDPDPDRGRNWDRDRDGYRDRERLREEPRDYGRDCDRDRDRDRGSYADRERDRGRDRGRERDQGREYDRDRDRDRQREQGRQRKP